MHVLGSGTLSNSSEQRASGGGSARHSGLKAQDFRGALSTMLRHQRVVGEADTQRRAIL